MTPSDAHAARTRVYLTVDVEGAEERMHNGQILPPQDYDLRVWGRFANQSREIGLRVTLDRLERHGLRGTFFVESLGAAFFGFDRLSEVCDELRSRGHDVQLHTHPIQKRADFRSRNEAPQSDNMHDYSVAVQAELMREGRDALGRCGVPAAEITCFRAGNFGASNDTWQAMANVGLTVSSNYNPCYFKRACRMRHDGSRPGLFRPIPGVWELPVSNFVERAGNFRHLQVTAISLAEMQDHLVQARQLGIGEVTVVMHPFEFFHIDSIRDRRGRPNTLNSARLEGLCRFLQQHSDDFQVETMGQLAARLAHETARAIPEPPTQPHPRGKLRHWVRRQAEQAVKRVEGRLPFEIPLAGSLAR